MNELQVEPKVFTKEQEVMWGRIVRLQDDIGFILKVLDDWENFVQDVKKQIEEIQSKFLKIRLEDK